MPKCTYPAFQFFCHCLMEFTIEPGHVMERPIGTDSTNNPGGNVTQCPVTWLRRIHSIHPACVDTRCSKSLLTYFYYIVGMYYRYNSWKLKYLSQRGTETKLNSARKEREYVTDPNCISAPSNYRAGSPFRRHLRNTPVMFNVAGRSQS